MKRLITAAITTLAVCGTLYADDIQVNAGFSKAGADFDSSLWEAAYTLKGFNVPLDDKKEQAATNDTEVRIASDGKRAYILINAFDHAMEHINVPPPPIDGYLNKFPAGDRIELAITARERFIFAFDCNGNKYLSKDYAPARYCWYDLKIRKTVAGWDAIVAFDWDNLLLEHFTIGKNFTFQAARHSDHGQGIERSYATGRSLLSSKSISLKE